LRGLDWQEYEGHVNLADAARDKANTCQEYLTMGDEYRAAAIEDMKSKWRQKLKRAHEAVIESKTLYDNSIMVTNQLQQELEDTRKRSQEYEDTNAQLTGEVTSLMVGDISPPHVLNAGTPTWH